MLPYGVARSQCVNDIPIKKIIVPIKSPVMEHHMSQNTIGFIHTIQHHEKEIEHISYKISNLLSYIIKG